MIWHRFRATYFFDIFSPKPLTETGNPPLSHGLIFSKFSSILKKRFYFFKIFLNFLVIFFASGGQNFRFLPLKSLFLCKKHPKKIRLRRFRGLIFSKFCLIFFSRFYFFKIFSNSESHGYFEEGGFVSYWLVLISPS